MTAIRTVAAVLSMSLVLAFTVIPTDALRASPIPKASAQLTEAAQSRRHAKRSLFVGCTEQPVAAEAALCR